MPLHPPDLDAIPDPVRESLLAVDERARTLGASTEQRALAEALVLALAGGVADLRFPLASGEELRQSPADGSRSQ